MHADPSMAFDRRGRLFYAALVRSSSGSERSTSTSRWRRSTGTAPASCERCGSTRRRRLTRNLCARRTRSTSRSTSRGAATTATSTWRTSSAPARAPGARAQRGRVGHPRRALHRSRQDLLAPAVIVGPEGRFTSFTDLAVGPDGTVYMTFRSSPTAGQRPIWIARSTDGGKTFSPAQLVVRFPTFDSDQFRGGPGAALSCGDGPFACPSGLSSAVQELRRGGRRPERRPRGVEPEASERPEQAVRPHVARRAHMDVPARDDRRRAVGAPVVARHRLRRRRHHRGVPRLAARPRLLARPPAGEHRAGHEPRTVGRHVRRDVTRRRAHVEGATAERATERSQLRDLPRRKAHLVQRLHLPVRRARRRVVAAWVDSRDLVPGDDTRPDSEENGFDVYAPCAWDPNTVAAPLFGYSAPPYTDPCLDQGGLDLNIYGAWVSRGRSCRGWSCRKASRASRGGPRSRGSHHEGRMGSARATQPEPAPASR